MCVCVLGFLAEKWVNVSCMCSCMPVILSYTWRHVHRKVYTSNHTKSTALPATIKLGDYHDGYPTQYYTVKTTQAKSMPAKYYLMHAIILASAAHTSGHFLVSTTQENGDQLKYRGASRGASDTVSPPSLYRFSWIRMGVALARYCCKTSAIASGIGTIIKFKVQSTALSGWHVYTYVQA